MKQTTEEDLESCEIALKDCMKSISSANERIKELERRDEVQIERERKDKAYMKELRDQLTTIADKTQQDTVEECAKIAEEYGKEYRFIKPYSCVEVPKRIRQHFKGKE